MSATRPSSMMLDTSDMESTRSSEEARGFGVSLGGPKGAQTSPSSSVSLHDYDLQQSNLTLLKAELKLVTHDRDILKKELSRYRQIGGVLPGSPLGSHPSSPAGSLSGTLPRSGLGGSTSGMGDRSQSSSSVRDYDALRQQCDMAMQELQLLKRQHIDTVRRCDAALKEADYYRNQHRAVVGKLDASNQESLNLRSQFGEILAGKRRLEQEISMISQAREEDRKELTELRLHQQDLLKAESGVHDESFQDVALRKYEAIKEDHEALRKRYSDLIASHSAAVSKLELAQEEVSRLKKQCETLDYDRNTAIRESKGLRQQCTAAIYQWNDAVQERDKLKDLLAKSQKEYQKAVKDIDEAMAVRMKASKEIKKLTEERNAAVQEYSLIMSERDSVHKEIEKLQDELNQATKKIKAVEGKAKELSEENKALHYQSESLRREVSSALLDRDEAIKEVNELRKRLGEQNDSNVSIDGVKSRRDNDIEKKDRDSRGERQDPGSGGFRGERDSKSQRGEQADNLDQANQEIERLRKLIEKLQTELNEAIQENEISKRRRDWAFSERDKIVSERETLRTYCDQLRRERDLEALKAAEVLRGNEELEKQRNDALKLVQDLREKLEANAERESRVNQLRGGVGPGPPQPHNQSCDSAIDSDGAADWEDTLEVTMVGGGEDLGFDISGGKSSPLYANDTGIYIGSVTKGSQVDGKLRANDCILKVGNLDCQNVDLRTVLETLYNTDGPITLLIRRRKSHIKGLYTVQVAIGAGQEHGISLESGVFVSRVAPGSPFAREADICPGDRILSINGRDYLRNSQEVLRILEDISNSGGLITLTVIRGVIMGQTVQSPRLSSPASTNTSAPMSASSSFHNMAEEAGSSKCEKCCQHSKSQPHLPPKDKKGTGGFNRLFNLSPHSGDRRHSSNEKVYKVNNRSSTSSSSGLGPFEIIRDRIARSRRHSKERISGREGSQECMRNQNVSPNSFHDKEDAAVAVFDFLNEYQIKDSKVRQSSQEMKKWEKQQAISSGGTWPRCRGGVVIHDSQTEQAFTVQKNRDRLPLSVFSGFTDSEEQHRTSLIDYDNWQCGQFPQSAMFRPIESGSALAGRYATLPSNPSRKGNEYENVENMNRLRTPLTPSDTSIDFSVKSGNVGNTLDYYVKKKGASKFSQSDCESESNISTSELTSAHVTTSSGCTHSLGSNTSLTAQLHNLRIHTQLYGSPTALPGMSQPSFQPYTSPYYSTTHSHTHTPNSPSVSLPPALSARYLSSPKPMNSSLSSPTSMLRRDLNSRGQFDACSDGFGSVNPSPVSQLYSHSPSPSVEMGYGYGSFPRNVVPSHSHSHPWSRSSTVDSQISQHGFGDLAVFGGPVEPKRIRMPSNQSMTSRSSVDRCSESPAPNLIVEYIGTNGNRTTEIRSMLKDLTWAKKPSPGDLRRIQIEKSINPSEPLGIEIVCPSNGGVFVSSVKEQSLAARVGLQVGDQLLEVCGINMRSATHSLAASVLRQCGDSVTMLVQYSPEKYEEATLHLEGHTRTQSHSDSPTPCNSPKPPRNPNIEVEDLPHSGSSTLRSPLNPEDALRSVLNYNLMMESGNGNSLRGSVNYDRAEPSFIRPKQLSLDEGSRNSYRHSSIDDKSSSGASTVRNSLRQSSLDEKSQNANARSSRRQASMDEKAMLRSSLNFDRERPASTYATMTRHQMSLPRQSTLLDGDIGRLEQPPQPDSRILFLELKKSSNLGVGLVGGNAVGIFIHQVHPDSPAQNAGLRCGDQILEYNGSDLRFSTAEQAAYELAKPAEKAAIVVQYNYERYKEILDQPGDSFYVKALFDRPGDGSFGSLGAISGAEGGELRFKKDDILFVDNTMYNGVPGLWRAWLLDPSGRKLHCGVIPSKYKVEEELLIRKSLGDLESGRGSITAARRSFFRRRNKLHRSSSRDSKELASFSDMGGGNYSETNTLSIHEDSSPILSYVRVERLDYQRPRPLILIGPLSEYVLDKLVTDQPSEYVRCLPEIVRASLSFVEKACNDLVYLDCRRRGSHFECTSVASVREIAESNRRCILDIPLHCVEKLHQCRIFPIVVFIKFKSVKQIREVKDGRLPADKLSGKAAKEMYDHACKVESEYRHLISAIVPAGSSFAYMRTQVVAAVQEEQRKTIWVPSGSLW